MHDGTGEMIAALYVAKNGSYIDLPGVDPWPEDRDARLYRGPHPVVAHPPCQRWGKLWAGQPLHIGSTRRSRQLHARFAQACFVRETP